MLIKIHWSLHSADRGHADPEEHRDQRHPRHAGSDHRRRHPPGRRCRREKGKGKKGKTTTQKGTFGGAIFKISQATGGANKGLATLTIVENAFKGAPSYSQCTKHKAADATAAKASSKTLQLLKSSAKGKFSTKGKYSAATGLGTKWTVAYRCDGTLTHDQTDSVKVTDFVHHKTITLHAGRAIGNEAVGEIVREVGGEVEGIA